MGKAYGIHAKVSVYAFWDQVYFKDHVKFTCQNFHYSQAKMSKLFNYMLIHQHP